MSHHKKRPKTLGAMDEAEWDAFKAKHGVGYEDILEMALAEASGLKRRVLRQRADPVSAVAPPGESAAITGKKWTPERLAELAAFRARHGIQAAATKFGISEQRIRQLLPTKQTASRAPSPHDPFGAGRKVKGKS